MKLLAKSVLLAGLIAFSSCSKDDGGTSNNSTSQEITTVAAFNDLIVGNWEMTAWEQKNGTSEFNGVTTTFSSVGRDFGGEITFNSDSTTLSGHYYSFDQTKTTAGVSVETSHDIPGFGYPGSYKILSVDELETSAIDGVLRIYNVSDLSDNTMTLETHIVDNNSSALINVDVIISLKKN